MTGDPDLSAPYADAMAGLTDLAETQLADGDLIAAALDLVAGAFPAPCLSLTLHLDGHMEQHVSARPPGNRAWDQEVARRLGDLQRQRLAGKLSSIRAVLSEQITEPDAWVETCFAEVRSGRRCALSLAYSLAPGTDAARALWLPRLTAQLLLVLDDARLLDQVESMDTVDGLTGAANHQRLLDLLEYELQRHRYFERRLAIILLDIEGLDNINRSYGHRYGNHILQKLASLLREESRPADTVSRYGLDEFAIVLPEIDGDGATGIVERLRERLMIVEFAGGSVGVSMALVESNPSESVSAEDLLMRAEQAVREVKRQERGWKSIWAPDQHGLSPYRARL